MAHDLIFSARKSSSAASKTWSRLQAQILNRSKKEGFGFNVLAFKTLHDDVQRVRCGKATIHLNNWRVTATPLAVSKQAQGASSKKKQTTKRPVLGPSQLTHACACKQLWRQLSIHTTEPFEPHCSSQCQVFYQKELRCRDQQCSRRYCDWKTDGSLLLPKLVFDFWGAVSQ